MTRTSIRSFLIVFAASGLVLAQTAPPASTVPASNPASNSGWQSTTGTPAATSQDAMQTAGPADAYGQPQRRTAGAPAARPAYGLPAQVTMKAGTFVTVRINEMLASNKSQPGDSFSGVLEQPIVVDGVVVAQRGQMIYGRVSQADKVKGVSHLGVELTGVTLADGEQVAVHSQLISRQGGMTPRGAQAGTIVGTTALGTVVGGAVGRGQGAAIGAGAGAAAGIVGVLTTRNHPSVIYPETALTFQIQSPLTIATGNAPAAFRYVGPEDYNHPATQRTVQRPGYSYYGYSPYYYPYYPYYWGPGLYLGGYWGGWGRFGGFGRIGGFRR